MVIGGSPIKFIAHLLCFGPGSAILISYQKFLIMSTPSPREVCSLSLVGPGLITADSYNKGKKVVISHLTSKPDILDYLHELQVLTTRLYFGGDRSFVLPYVSNSARGKKFTHRKDGEYNSGLFSPRGPALQRHHGQYVLECFCLRGKARPE